MKSAGLVAAVVFAATLLLPGTSQAIFEDDQARKAILAERARIDKLTADFGARLSDLTTRLERLEATARGQLALQSQIQTLQQEIAKLRGMLEEQTNELSTTQRALRDKSDEFETRMRRFEPVAVEIDGRSQRVDPAERRSFEAALAAFGAKDFRAAQTAFQVFLLNHPTSPYVPSALYWLGSSQFALKDYKGAADTLNTVAQRHADSPRAPEAMLNLAYTQIELNDRRAARRTLETLIEKYPEAQVAATARERMQTL
ncbi:MAG: tol-pal system protein YbgF, partial [Betaproteobacteria bacterium]|nr:tol-pal system protein YbgF [Betaproteobacteria bacterium]